MKKKTLNITIIAGLDPHDHFLMKCMASVICPRYTLVIRVSIVQGRGMKEAKLRTSATVQDSKSH